MTTGPLPSPSNLASRRLLIADDSADMRELVRTAIGDEFGEVIEAADGRELLWMLLRASIDDTSADLVVVTDLMMPTYGGLQVLDAVQGSSRIPQIPTILITAFPSESIHAQARELGVRVLSKPFSTSELRAALKQVTRVDRC